MSTTNRSRNSEMNGIRPGGYDHVGFADCRLASELFTKPALGNFVWKQRQFQSLLIKLDLVRRFLQTSQECLIDFCKAR